MSQHHTRSPILSFMPALATLFALAVALLLIIGRGDLSGLPVIGFFLALAVYSHTNRVLATISFSLWMAAFVAASLFYPAVFIAWGPIQLKGYIMALIMSVMFCMGTTLSFDDFKRVALMPRAVLIGVILQFTVMPFVGKGVAMVFTHNREIAAGIVLTGSSPGGVASNVMTFLAGGNVALSVTMTAISTMLSPLATPTMTRWLADVYVPVDFWEMVVSILKMIVVPVGGGLVMHAVLERLGKVHPVYMRVYHGIMRLLPKYSMFAIVMVCAILTANARDQLLGGTIVIGVIGAVICHNVIGLTLGYWGARATGLSERDCRTIAIEVGLQNSGMSAVLAVEVLKSTLASIPGVVYSTWHNITGALLAGWWAHHPPKDGE